MLVTKFKLLYFGHNSLEKAVMQRKVKEKMTNSKMGRYSYSGDECPVGKSCSLQLYLLPTWNNSLKMGIIDV